ncbi:MAG: 23S rRNA (pseudouridine(1915)-N(3))-methyltransferase RlmH, partial [Bacilli bacterium]|nr:23S rRNA (pseudouridine(1915)-N(3))-methyltransferase RlmH [Bacilli bacterium]
MINIICVGKLKDKYLVDMSNDYLTRLTKYHKVNIIELKDSNIKSPSA